MTDSHDQMVSSSIFSTLVPEVRDGIARGIERILCISNEVGTLTPERFNELERTTLDACLDLGRSVLRGILQDQDAQLPGEIEQDGEVLRRRTRTAKTITTLLGEVAYWLCIGTNENFRHGFEKMGLTVVHYEVTVTGLDNACLIGWAIVTRTR